jgi:hypothetical protein
VHVTAAIARYDGKLQSIVNPVVLLSPITLVGDGGF